MNDGNIWITKQSDCPNLGLGLIKMDYFKVCQGLSLERMILYEQKGNFMKNELKGDNQSLA